MRKEGNSIRFGPEMLPCCGHIVTAVSLPNPKEQIVMPRTDDLTVCLNCGAILIYTDDAGALRLLRREELAELERETIQQLELMVRIIKRRGPLPRMRPENN